MHANPEKQQIFDLVVFRGSTILYEIKDFDKIGTRLRHTPKINDCCF